MKLIKPFPALRPLKPYVEAVVAPPYDVVSSMEAKKLAENKPNSFLHISKPEIDCDASLNPFDKIVYEKGAENLHQLINKGVLQQDDKPCYYIYRMTQGKHQQTGLVCATSVKAYEAKKIKIHEYTRPDKETDRVQLMLAHHGNMTPLILTHKNDVTLKLLLNTITKEACEFDVRSEDGVRHQLWVVNDDKLINELSDLVNAMPALYMADGHHRSAAAARVAHGPQ